MVIEQPSLLFRIQQVENAAEQSADSSVESETFLYERELNAYKQIIHASGAMVNSLPVKSAV